MPTKRATAPANEVEADELLLHIDNVERLYRQRLAIEDMLRRKALKGKYDGALAPKAFLYVVDVGARDYRKENRMVGGFNPATRLLVAKDLTRRFEGEFEQLSHHASNKRMANPSRRRKSAAKRRGSSASQRNPSRGMTKEQAVAEFRSIYPAGSFIGRSGRLDRPMAREAWNNFTDALNKDRRITDVQYNRWSGLPQYNDRKRR